MSFNRTFVVISIAALMFLCVTAGSAMMYFEVGVYRILRNPFIAAEALFGAEARSDDINIRFTGAKPASRYDKSFPPVRDQLTGVTRYDPATAQNGFTIYAAKKQGVPVINLVGMDGKRVHQWTISAKKLAASAPEFKRVNEKQINAMPYLFSNGDLLVVLTAKGTTPWGLGLVKLDKDSNVIWYFSEPVHHDSDVGPEGEIYTLGHFVDLEPRAGLEKITTPFLDDTVIVLSQSGEKLQEISILNAIRDSEFQSILRFGDPTSYNGDLLHANSIQRLTEEQLINLPMVSPGSLLISLRNIDTLIIIDPKTERVVWALRGGWHLQHDPDMLPNGDILLFDNQGDISAGAEGSRTIQFNPVTLEKVWEFPGDGKERLYSSVKSSQQRLSNGNTLITETNNGRILEVTSNNEVVWEFYIPERLAKGDNVFSKVIDAQRVDPEFIEFEFNYR